MTANQPPISIEKFISTISDTDRLKLISYLSHDMCTVLELSEMMKVEPSSIMRHLEVLEGANLVAVSEHGANRSYKFNSKTIELLARQQFEKPRHDTSFINLPDDQRKLVSSYIQADGSLKMIPAQTKKINLILDYIIGAFKYDVDYSEVEVNEVLVRYHADTAILRRYLVDYCYLARERDGSRYWRRTDHSDPSRKV